MYSLYFKLKGEMIRVSPDECSHKEAVTRWQNALLDNLHLSAELRKVRANDRMAKLIIKPTRVLLTEEAVRAAWESGKDFLIKSGRDKGRYVSIRDVPTHLKDVKGNCVLVYFGAVNENVMSISTES